MHITLCQHKDPLSHPSLIYHFSQQASIAIFLRHWAAGVGGGVCTETTVPSLVQKAEKFYSKVPQNECRVPETSPHDSRSEEYANRLISTVSCAEAPM